MGRRKAAGRAEGSTEPTRKSRRLYDREQSAPAAEKKKVGATAPPKTKKVKEVAKAKPEEEKKEESKANEEIPAENGDAKAEEPAAADKTVEKDCEAEKDGKTE